MLIDPPKALRTVLAMGHKFDDVANQCDCGAYWGDHQKDPKICETERKESRPGNYKPPGTHCRRGHSYEEHGYFSGRSRRCKICRDINKRDAAKRRERQSDQAATNKRWCVPHRGASKSSEFQGFGVKKKARADATT